MHLISVRSTILLVFSLCLFITIHAQKKDTATSPVQVVDTVKPKDTLTYPVGTEGTLQLIRKQDTLFLYFITSRGDTTSTPLLQPKDSVDFASANLAGAITDTTIAQQTRDVLQSHRADILKTLGLTELPDKRVVLSANAPSPPAPAASGSGAAASTTSSGASTPTVLDQFTYVMQDTIYIVTLQRVTISGNKVYQVVLQPQDSASPALSHTYTAGKIFYPTYFQLWLDVALNRIDASTKLNLVNRLIETLQRFQEQEAMQQRTVTATTILDSLEAEDAKPRIAGQLRWIGSWTLPVYGKPADAWDKSNALSKYTFRVDNVRIYTDYNRISDLRFTGTLFDSRGDSSRQTFANNNFSIGFPTLNHINQAFRTKQGNQYLYLNPKGIITYEPVMEAYSNNVKNTEVSLQPGASTAILQRRSFSDFIGLQVFLDPFGFFNDRPNGFTQLEGAAYVPMNHKNVRKMHLFVKNTTTFSYVFTNAVNSDPRFAKLDPTIFQKDIFFEQEVKQPLLNNLDLVRNYFYQLNTKFALLSFEFKGASTWLHINTGFRVWGSRIGPNRDSIRTHHRLFFEPLSVSLEVRPDRPFGLNADIGVGFLNDMRRYSSNPEFPLNPQFLYAKSVVVPHEVNFYHYLNDRRKGGLFFRYAGYFAHNKKMRADPRDNPALNRFAKISDYFPMILVGYSTNISALIKGEVLKSNGSETAAPPVESLKLLNQ